MEIAAIVIGWILTGLAGSAALFVGVKWGCDREPVTVGDAILGIFIAVAFGPGTILVAGVLFLSSDTKFVDRVVYPRPGPSPPKSRSE